MGGDTPYIAPEGQSDYWSLGTAVAPAAVRSKAHFHSISDFREEDPEGYERYLEDAAALDVPVPGVLDSPPYPEEVWLPQRVREELACLEEESNVTEDEDVEAEGPDSETSQKRDAGATTSSKGKAPAKIYVSSSDDDHSGVDHSVEDDSEDDGDEDIQMRDPDPVKSPVRTSSPAIAHSDAVADEPMSEPMSEPPALSASFPPHALTSSLERLDPPARAARLPLQPQVSSKPAQVKKPWQPYGRDDSDASTSSSEPSSDSSDSVSRRPPAPAHSDRSLLPTSKDEPGGNGLGEIDRLSRLVANLASPTRPDNREDVPVSVSLGACNLFFFTTPSRARQRLAT